MPMRKMSEQQIWFRWNKKNRYTIAALLPLLNGARLTDEPRPGIMLYSIATPQAEEVYREVDAARASGIDAIFIAGGPHPSARPIETLEHFDYVVIGEGEETLPELIDAIRTGRDVESVRGIAYLREGKPVITERREFVDLDRYPSFTYPLLAPIEISRGCPWRCAYCQTPRPLREQDAPSFDILYTKTRKKPPRSEVHDSECFSVRVGWHQTKTREGRGAPSHLIKARKAHLLRYIPI